MCLNKLLSEIADKKFDQTVSMTYVCLHVL